MTNQLERLNKYKKVKITFVDHNDRKLNPCE